MNDIIFTVPPDSVEIDGVIYPIDSDFRVCVAIEREVYAADPDIDGILRLFYRGSVPPDIDRALDVLLTFFTGPPAQHTDPEREKRGGRVYDFSQDEDVLISSFFAVYGIDLTTVKLHWWTFKRLLLCMPSDSQFMQRVGYRTADTKGMPKDMRKHYKKMKSLYSIRETGEKKKKTVEERDAAMLAWANRRFEEACSCGT